jgi:tetratricopeptide (TPR) repeat protein
MNSHLIRISLPLLVLCLFYKAIYDVPSATQAGDLALLSPGETREILDLSRKKLSENKPEDALLLTEKLHKAYPQNHIYIEQLANLYHQMERYQEEAQSWEAYLKFSPTPVEACPQIGQAYRSQGLLKETLDACQRCYAMDDKNVDSIFFLALAYERNHQLDKARALYERGLQLYAPSLDTRIGLARVLHRQGNTAKAKEMISRVYEQAPDNVDCLLVLGMILRSEGNLAEAKTHLARGAQLSLAYTDFYVVLGGIAEQEGDLEKALQYYNRVLELEPENRDIATRRKRLGGGRS